MKCPKCESKLTLRENEGHVGYTCSSCKGIWLPLRYLQTLEHTYSFKVNEFISNLESAKQESTDYVCPSCSHNLEKSLKNNVTLEYCAKCSGIWFDKNELGELITNQKSSSITGSVVAEGAADILLIIGSFLSS